MEPSSSFVKHNEFSRCFLATNFLQTDSRAPCRRELRKGESKRNLRQQKPRSACFCLVSRNLFSARHPPSPDSCIFHTARNQELSWNSVSGSTWGNLCETWSRTQQRILKSGKKWQSVLVYGETRAGWCVWAFREYKETSARCWEPTCKDKVGLTQYANLRHSILWKSLQECSTEVESSWGWSNDGWNSLCNDLGIVYVSNEESISSSWVKLQWEFGCVQEHQFQRGQDVVRRYAEVDLKTCTRDSECSHDWMEILPLDEIHFTTWQSYQVGESKSTRLLQMQFFYVWETCLSILKHMQDGRINSLSLNDTMRTEN